MASEKPMVDLATAPWDLNISDADFEKLKAGFQARDMDDKWTILAANSHLNDERATTITITRSWTGRRHYIFILKPSDSEMSAKIQRITWEQNKGGIYISEELGKMETVLLCRGILECDFDELPEYDGSTLWNHPSARLGADYLTEKDRYSSSAGRESS